MSISFRTNLLTKNNYSRFSFFFFKTYFTCIRFDCFMYMHMLFQSTRRNKSSWLNWIRWNDFYLCVANDFRHSVHWWWFCFKVEDKDNIVKEFFSIRIYVPSSKSHSNLSSTCLLYSFNHLYIYTFSLGRNRKREREKKNERTLLFA